MHRYIPLPFKAHGFSATSANAVTVSLLAVAAEVDLTTGTVASTVPPHEYRRGQPREASLALGDLIERREETSEGPVTTLQNDVFVARIRGEVTQAWRSDRCVVTISASPGEAPLCTAFVLGVVSRLQLPVAWRVSLAGEGNYAASASDEVLHVFRFEGESVKCVSVALPPALTEDGPEVFVTGARVCVVCGDELIVVDASALEFDDVPRGRPISYEPLVGSASGDDAPATVAFALPESILLDHPKFKRLRVPRAAGDADLAKGDHVILDDVREELPGIFKVYAWHKAGASKSARPLPPALTFAAPRLEFEAPARPAVTASARPRDSQTLKGLAAHYGFRAPELLVRLLETREGEPAFSRWLDKLGLDCIEVRTLTDWDADPHLLAFAGLGNGDEFSLYVYPPWCDGGHEPIVVEFFHETNSVEFRALTFDAFLDAFLDAGAENAEDVGEATELVRRVRERLAFPKGSRDFGNPPGWLLPAAVASEPPSGAPETSSTGFFGSLRKLFSKPPAKPLVASVERALRVERSGDLLSAERELLALFLGGGDEAPRAGTELRRLYEKLGWSFAKENISTSSNLAT
ncbi:MAG: SMI1/KNR4 family protein [Polyangiaceae bacterium]